MERFDLLDEHYVPDVNRLNAVSEAGLFLVSLPAGRCPLWGAPAGDHRHEGLPPKLNPRRRPIPGLHQQPVSRAGPILNHPPGKW